MKVLMLVQRVDLDDPILAFTHTWIEKLAQRVEKLYCISLAVGRHNLDESGVRLFSLGKEQDYRLLADLHYGVNLYKAFWTIEELGGVDVVFCHMAPVFALAAAPYARLKGLPLLLWYAHPEVSWRLRAAHRVCTRMVTSLKESYRHRHDKVSVVGQGIDTDLFSPGGEEETPPSILCVGRISPSKDLTTLLQAAARLRKKALQPFRVCIVGGPGTPGNESYLEQLKSLGSTLGLDDILSFEGPVPYGEPLVERYRGCAVHVNLTPSGFGDKVALEAMSCAKPCLLANEGYRDVLGHEVERLWFAPGDPEDLARKLHGALNLSPEGRGAVGHYLRERVIHMHGLERLMDRLVELFGGLVADSRGGAA